MEKPFEWDTNQLLQILCDTDQAHGEDAQDLKKYVDYIEDRLRNLDNFIRRQPSLPVLVPEAQSCVKMLTPIIIQLKPV